MRTRVLASVVVAVSQIHDWLAERMRRGIQLDARVLAGIALIQAHR